MNAATVPPPHHDEEIDSLLKQCRRLQSPDSLDNAIRRKMDLVATLRRLHKLLNLVEGTTAAATESLSREVIHLERVIWNMDEELEGCRPHNRDDDNDDEKDDDDKCFSEALKDLDLWEENMGSAIRSVEGLSGNAGCNDDDNDEDNEDSDDPERWIDACLEACGHRTSLEASIDCLRHHSTKASAHSPTRAPRLSPAVTPTTDPIESSNDNINISAAVTSLRTIRRYLLRPLPRDDCSLGAPTSLAWRYVRLPLEYYHFENSPTNHVSDARKATAALGVNLSNESLLADVALGLPSLLSSACFAQGLPLPSWAPPRNYRHRLLKNALSGAIIGNRLSEIIDRLPTGLAANNIRRKQDENLIIHLLKHFSKNSPKLPMNDTSLDTKSGTNQSQSPTFTISPSQISNLSKSVQLSTSTYFRSLLKQMIHQGHSDVAAKVILNIWDDYRARTNITNTSSSTPTTRLVARLVTETLMSTPSQREVSSFLRSMLFCGKKLLRSNNDRTYQRDQIPLSFYTETMLPILVNKPAIAEMLVHRVILSPPTFFPHTNDYGDAVRLHPMDRIVPQCLVRLLAYIETQPTPPAKVGTSAKFINIDNSGSDSDSDDSDISNNSSESQGNFLSHIRAVASIWSEDIFVTRTDALQQQYVTEFLLHSLPLITKYDLERSNKPQFVSHGADNRADDTPLAAKFIQGITIRLEVNQIPSVRLDGMRVAEAMANIFDQKLSFDELRLHDDKDDSIPDDTKDSIHDDKKGNNHLNTQTTSVNVNKNTLSRKKKLTKAQIKPKQIDPDADYFTDDSTTTSNDDDNDNDEDDTFSTTTDSDISSHGEDSLQPYHNPDDSFDLLVTPPPRSLRMCHAYLLTPDNDSLAFEKHSVALSSLPSIVRSRALDLEDVAVSLSRVLLHLEDKFGIDQFEENRMASLVALAVHAPLDTVGSLVLEMKENVSLGTRFNVLAVIGEAARELSGRNKPKSLAMEDNNHNEKVTMSTRLQLALNLSPGPNSPSDQHAPTTIPSSTKVNAVLSAGSKTRRWRHHPRSPVQTIANQFGPISAQIISILFAFLSHTKHEDSIWGGSSFSTSNKSNTSSSTGEKFLCEYLKTLSLLVYCANTHPGTSILAMDLFQLVYNLRHVENSQVRHAILVALATTLPLIPVEFFIQVCFDGVYGHEIGEIHSVNHDTGLIPFLKQCSLNDSDESCRLLAASIVDTIVQMTHNSMITM